MAYFDPPSLFTTLTPMTDQEEDVVQVSFVTNNAAIRVTDTPIAVPLRLTR